MCPNIDESPDNKDYLLKLVPIPYECCSAFEREACKYNDKVYREGDEWSGEGDYCLTYKCENNEGIIQKVPHLAQCETKCELGFVYEIPTPESKTCCGSCKQVQCVTGSDTKEEGEKWLSENLCFSYDCIRVNGSVSVYTYILSAHFSFPSACFHFWFKATAL